MLQTLHLDGVAAPVAVLLEGPALRLRRPEAADRFAPLAGLARVTVHGPRVHWRPEAMLACLEAGIPVVFLGARGALAGVLVPSRPPRQRADLPGLLDLAASVPGFRGRLEDFCRAARCGAAQAAVRALGLGGGEAREAPRRLAEAALAAAAEPEAARAALRELKALAAAAVAAGLARRGLGPHFLARRTGGFPLPELLGEALSWHVLPVCWRRVVASRRDGGGALHSASRHALIRAFESADPDGQIDRLLARLAVALASEMV
jgi:hypothetical protein